MDYKFMKNAHMMVAAPTGGGKSYFVGWMAEKLYQAGRRFIILDTKTRNHIGLVALKKLKLLKIKPNTQYDYWKLINYDQVLCIPTERTKTKELINHYRAILDTVFAAKKPITVFVEEAHNYNPNPHVPDELLELIAREGRSSRINLVFITQRIQDFPKLLWSQCKLTYLFKFMIPQDVKYIARMIPNFEEINRELQKHDCLEYDHESNEVRIIRASEIIRRTRHYG
ncbi:type IV secretory system conjugative DNA transfer family protein [Archaeoglobus neptunius]|uniref:type IV secretory system conjugative DNA transfer family protein n=1 Tax=Archaeoglobus neptunius TaxID=2798580 RepID=UPI001928DBE6|nr:type IV secretory system conjugative DNA transfer family protein [Archaeoglobus neptunius]